MGVTGMSSAQEHVNVLLIVVTAMMSTTAMIMTNMNMTRKNPLHSPPVPLLLVIGCSSSHLLLRSFDDFEIVDVQRSNRHVKIYVVKCK